MAAAGGTENRIAPVEFAGTRRELFGLLFRGYLLMVPTIGIHRFWVTTAKRRFYWQNTIVDGEPLEYSGSALQLLIGFLFAVAFFLPLYIAGFYLSTQSTDVVVPGYAVIAAVFWFMIGYAQFRARDFRLSRTLWRGIRFAQHGNAWLYALRRFLWSIVVVLTLGLAYPFMAAGLCRYRYRHTWYGDRPFRWTGSWKTYAVPYYLSCLIVAATVLAALVHAGMTPSMIVEGAVIPGPSALAGFAAAAFVIALTWCYYRAGEASRVFSEVWVGEARAAVKVRALALFGQLLSYGTMLLLVLIVLAVIALTVAGVFFEASLDGPETITADIARAAQSSWVVLPLLILGYLAVLGAFTLLAEVYLGCGYWMLVARGATISNPDSLASVRATGEDSALAGEGLADAMNVGAY